MKIGQNRHKMEALASIRAQWRSQWSNIRTWFINEFPNVEALNLASNL